MEIVPYVRTILLYILAGLAEIGGGETTRGMAGSHPGVAPQQGSEMRDGR